MPTTLIHKILYPLGSVAPNVPVVLQSLAESVESALTAILKRDKRQLFRHNGYAWAANASWDAGTLTADTTTSASSQLSVPTPTFCSPGSLAGTLKFNEPGLYDVKWIIQPGADPGNSGYRIVTSGTWPGNPASPDNIFGQTNRHSGAQFWESTVEGVVRVPTAGLEVRLVGIQTAATTNAARVIVTQKGLL